MSKHSLAGLLATLISVASGLLALHAIERVAALQVTMAARERVQIIAIAPLPSITPPHGDVIEGMAR